MSGWVGSLVTSDSHSGKERRFQSILVTVEIHHVRGVCADQEYHLKDWKFYWFPSWWDSGTTLIRSFPST